MIVTNLKGTGISITPAINDYLEKRLSGLEKWLEGSEYILDVELGKTTQHHKSGDVFKAEANLKLEGKQMYAVVEKEDLYAAIDELKDEIGRQIISGKEKKKTLFRRGAHKIKNLLKGIRG